MNTVGMLDFIAYGIFGTIPGFVLVGNQYETGWTVGSKEMRLVFNPDYNSLDYYWIDIETGKVDLCDFIEFENPLE